MFRGSRVAYWGCIGTRGNLPYGYNSGITSLMSETWHFMRDAFTSIKLVYPNWYVDTNNNTDTWTELGTGSTATVKASFTVAPYSSPVQVLFGGSASGSITSGSNLLSDAVSVSGAAGDLVRVRTSFVNSGGIIYLPSKADDTFGDRSEFTATDKTMSGTVALSAGHHAYFPGAILALTTKRTDGLIGTSRTFGGVAEAVDGVTGDLGELARAIGPRYGYINSGIPGDSAQRMSASMTKRVGFLNSYCSDVAVSHGINDVGGLTLSQFQPYYEAILNSFPLKRVRTVTVSPHTSGAWAQADGSDQTSLHDMRTWNTYMRTRPCAAVGCYDIVPFTSIGGLELKWVANTTSDGLHGLQASNLLIKAGLIV